jgi:hypothetical protein
MIVFTQKNGSQCFGEWSQNINEHFELHTCLHYGLGPINLVFKILLKWTKD